ncbi:hypothetical protein ACJRO7_009134 [Eucalyptus globulus]|uniref:Uncharacterized protein n=1 Tax=Eucalyptus globulus TaxID=34317 RepID=A0ABD3IUM4_EUCGL
MPSIRKRNHPNDSTRKRVLTLSQRSQQLKIHVPRIGRRRGRILQVRGGEEAAVICMWWKVLADYEGPGEKKERGGEVDRRERERRRESAVMPPLATEISGGGVACL